MRLFITFAVILGLSHCNNYNLVEKLENPGGLRSTPASAAPSTGPVFKTDVFVFWNLNGNLNDSWDNGTGLQNASSSGYTYTADRYGRANHAISFPAGISANFGHYVAYATAPFTVCMWLRLQTAGTNLTIGAGGIGGADFDDIVFYSRKLTLAKAQQNFLSDLQ